MQKTKFRHKMWVGWGTPYRVPTDPTCAEIFDVGIQIKRLILFQTRILSTRNPKPQPVNTLKSPSKVNLDQSSAQIRRENGWALFFQVITKVITAQSTNVTAAPIIILFTKLSIFSSTFFPVQGFVCCACTQYSNQRWDQPG